MRSRSLRFAPRMPYADIPPDPRDPEPLPKGAGTLPPRTVVAEIGPDGMPYIAPMWEPSTLDDYAQRLGPQDYAPRKPSFDAPAIDLGSLADVPPQYDARRTGEYGREDFWRDRDKWDAMPEGADLEAYKRQMMIDRDVDGAQLARERARRGMMGRRIR